MKMDLSLLRTLKIGDEISGDLLVKTARKAMTRGASPKPYVNVTLSDGVTSTISNVWNWVPENIPQPNDVVTIYATVGEYMNNRQLNITTFGRSSGTSDQFLPTGSFNIDTYMERFKSLASMVTVPLYKCILNWFIINYEETWRVAPSALGMHHDCIAGNLWHSVDTCNNALAIYANYSAIANLDLVITGALLHDIGKLQTYKFNGAVIEMTVEGQLLDHIPLGIQVIETNFKEVAEDMGATEALLLLEHCIAAHHGKLEYGSPVGMRCPEAIIINYADGVDAKMRNFATLNENAGPGLWTDKMYMLDNRPMLKTEYIRKVLKTNETMD